MTNDKPEDNSNIVNIITWCGADIEQLDREQLLEALRDAYDLSEQWRLEAMRQSHRSLQK